MVFLSQTKEETEQNKGSGKWRHSGRDTNRGLTALSLLLYSLVHKMPEQRVNVRNRIYKDLYIGKTMWQYVWSLKKKTRVFSKQTNKKVCSLCHRDPTLGIFARQRSKNPEEGIRKHKDVSTAFFINNIKKVYDQLHLFHSLHAISSEDYMASM